MIYHGDCYDLLPIFADYSFDMVLTDLPYGVTKNSWDSVIDLNWLWKQYHRLAKPNAAIVLFGQDLFSATLKMSNPKEYRYSWIWQMINSTAGFLNAKRRPLRGHQDILVFYQTQPTYNPIFTEGKPSHAQGYGRAAEHNRNYGAYKPHQTDLTRTKKYPKTVLPFPVVPNGKRLHATEKPVALCEYLIRTYTNPGAFVLDNCAGSGSTVVAAVQSGRQAIGIEKDEEIFTKASARLTKLTAHPTPSQ